MSTQEWCIKNSHPNIGYLYYYKYKVATLEDVVIPLSAHSNRLTKSTSSISLPAWMRVYILHLLIIFFCD